MVGAVPQVDLSARQAGVLKRAASTKTISIAERARGMAVMGRLALRKHIPVVLEAMPIPRVQSPEARVTFGMTGWCLRLLF